MKYKQHQLTCNQKSIQIHGKKNDEGRKKINQHPTKTPQAISIKQCQKTYTNTNKTPHEKTSKVSDLNPSIPIKNSETSIQPNSINIYENRMANKEDQPSSNQNLSKPMKNTQRRQTSKRNKSKSTKKSPWGTNQINQHPSNIHQHQ